MLRVHRVAVVDRATKDCKERRVQVALQVLKALVAVTEIKVTKVHRAM